MTGPEPRTTILVLHQDDLDPRQYIDCLIDQPKASGSSSQRLADRNGTEQAFSLASTSIPWTIDNKYYSAEVTVQCYPQGAFEQSLAQDVEVVVYLFSNQLRSLPHALVKLMAKPRDIALAVRIPHLPNEEVGPTPGHAQPEGQGSVYEGDAEIADHEDLFDELGMEFLDETATQDEVDDERPVPILEQVRQTLMTHMWPNMVRKPLSASTRGIDEDLLSSPSSELPASDDAEPSSASAFPIAFDSSRAGPSTSSALTTANEFPGADELRSQILLEDTERLGGGFSRLEMLDQEDEDWVQAEYSRLDDWLDGDDEGQIDGSDQPYVDAPEPEDEGQEQEPPRPLDEVEESQFDDDFADFMPFQSAPAAPISDSSDVNLPLDPTPLLLHLQNVREELAGLDEDTRRQRAGKEVETVLRSLGLGGLDWEDDDLADLTDSSIKP